MFKTILFPIDQSREPRHAVETVADLVKTYQSRLILLSVVEPPDPEAEATSEVMTSHEAVAKLLAGAKTLFTEQGIDAETVEREGKVSFTICDVADDMSADLIIMGCRGVGLTDEGASESVTNRVINLSPCPVLIVP